MRTFAKSHEKQLAAVEPKQDKAQQRNKVISFVTKNRINLDSARNGSWTLNDWATGKEYCVQNEHNYWIGNCTLFIKTQYCYQFCTWEEGTRGFDAGNSKKNRQKYYFKQFIFFCCE